MRKINLINFFFIFFINNFGLPYSRCDIPSTNNSDKQISLINGEFIFKKILTFKRNANLKYIKICRKMINLTKNT